jgi:hypothetical protein
MLFGDEKHMEFRQLRYFLAVAEHLHFTEAGVHLGMAQGVVAKIHCAGGPSPVILDS